jgi:hypothetical protein
MKCGVAFAADDKLCLCVSLTLIGFKRHGKVALGRADLTMLRSFRISLPSSELICGRLIYCCPDNRSRTSFQLSNRHYRCHVEQETLDFALEENQLRA